MFNIIEYCTIIVQGIQADRYNTLQEASEIIGLSIPEATHVYNRLWMEGVIEWRTKWPWPWATRIYRINEGRAEAHGYTGRPTVIQNIKDGDWFFDTASRKTHSVMGMVIDYGVFKIQLSSGLEVTYEELATSLLRRKWIPTTDPDGDIGEIEAVTVLEVDYSAMERTLADDLISMEEYH